ncbi:hypothetical protein EKO27_g4988 [Xylaria grammica]|uniref:Uncharacterized protein n=1 Tax=Xylaria grammica TaxID=363999 RepID=A0A439D6U1_9PEZI|nr:hypothetical protein EKO27_g4988 [Xylaria grammica]
MPASGSGCREHPAGERNYYSKDRKRKRGDTGRDNHVSQYHRRRTLTEAVQKKRESEEEKLRKILRSKPTPDQQVPELYKCIHCQKHIRREDNDPWRHTGKLIERPEFLKLSQRFRSDEFEEVGSVLKWDCCNVEKGDLPGLGHDNEVAECKLWFHEPRKGVVALPNDWMTFELGEIEDSEDFVGHENKEEGEGKEEGEIVEQGPKGGEDAKKEKTMGIDKKK